MIDLTTLADLTPGICSVTLRAQGIDEVVRISSEAGLAGIEWGTDVHVSDTESAAHARKATEEAGMKVLSLGTYYRVGSSGDFERELDLAVAAGAPRVRVWAGELGSADADQNHWDAVVADARRIADLAGQRGVAVAFEYHGNTLTDSPGTTLDLLDRVNHPNVGTYWQPAVGLSDQQALESLHQVLPHVVGIHCFSWGPEAERFPLRNRKLLWQTVTDVLRGNGTDMDIMLEFVEDDLPDNVLNDAAFLHTITLGED
ncbi:sugar phosphate isomerase/epimerase family protein [Paenarthrobacter ilicis]|uniref:Sugar phosphate isomerase/epimerase n=1 Tax=Paenarthrobacter ilicis TaxID=43665 RepID=A0ABX0TKR7_9MICC|nr:sugar phosphate isomerase/epimerase [Paenarthrobacter ilicis]MBM7794626.1 sugar phosphate isomerase/epimerase [Paenarthrobacter ilicis]NIJ02450.1 sugar phosphate isomerase/epimerase [Paenarthrobacter ilicis]